MAEPRYSDERQGKLKRFAHGKCSADQERIGTGLRYFPTIRKERIADPAFADGFEHFAEAVFAAREFQQDCKQHLAEPNGSM